MKDLLRELGIGEIEGSLLDNICWGKTKRSQVDLVQAFIKMQVLLVSAVYNMSEIKDTVFELALSHIM